MRITESVLVEAPASDVWAVLTDLGSHPRWRPALREFRQVSEGPLRVGARIHEVIAWRGREIVLADEVTALEPERRLAIRGGWKAADFDLDMLLDPRGQSTSVTFDWLLRPKTLTMRLVAPFLRGTMRRSTLEEVEGLRTYVERGPEALAARPGHASPG
jgi:uncharacterized protein YndB with AHSA1/START domain